ncbi:hypothetical protein M513_04889 [Trichuris suis]|uniref:RRM domain-containing protein n=1 Tax=Trichuris suis TaxID=68888 RepID=A0A085MA66_9BILA|nr:hypothetical protein M513_04889 [Trichuris suis]
MGRGRRLVRNQSRDHALVLTLDRDLDRTVVEEVADIADIADQLRGIIAVHAGAVVVARIPIRMTVIAVDAVEATAIPDHRFRLENPPPTRCLGVFGLSTYTTERDLHQFFSKWGVIEDVHLVYDHPSGRSRGFGFVYYERTEDAVMVVALLPFFQYAYNLFQAKEQASGVELDGESRIVMISTAVEAITIVVDPVLVPTVQDVRIMGRESTLCTTLRKSKNLELPESILKCEELDGQKYGTFKGTRRFLVSFTQNR